MSLTATPAPPEISPTPPRRELDALLTLIEARTAEEKHYLLEHLLRQVLGDKPPRETRISNADGTPYAYILEPQHRIGLFATPERIAMWNSQDPAKTRPNRELIDILLRGDEEEVRAYIKELNA